MRKGVSPMIATVLLIALAVTLATIIFSAGKDMIQLSPAPSCDDIVFEAEILKYQDNYALAVNNLREVIAGFEITITDELTGTKDIKTVILEVGQGESESKLIDFGSLLLNRELAISPLLKNANGEPTACRFEKNQKLKVVTTSTPIIITTGPITPVGTNTANENEVQGTQSSTAGTNTATNTAQLT